MLRVALVGAGVMGANHARVINGDRHSELAYVVDPDLQRAAAVARVSGARVVGDLEEVLGEVDAAVVAAPTEHHVELGCRFLEAGIAVLVEKPIASRIEDARRLVAAAQESGRPLAVGHVERFNPAVLELEAFVAEPEHIDFRRISAFTTRARESVVRDLMIHDIDLARLLVGAEPVQVSAISRRRGQFDDLVVALLTFESGVSATLTASRMGQQKIRDIAVTQKENYIHVDLVREDITIHRVHHVEFLAEGGPRYSQSGVIEIPYLSQRGEPLALQWAHFVNCVRGESEVRVSGQDGLRALAIAEQIERACTRD